MAWFWGSSKQEEDSSDEEYTDSEGEEDVSSGEYESDDEEEDSDDDEDGEEEEEHNGDDKDDANDEEMDDVDIQNDDDSNHNNEKDFAEIKTRLLSQEDTTERTTPESSTESKKQTRHQNGEVDGPEVVEEPNETVKPTTVEPDTTMTDANSHGALAPDGEENAPNDDEEEGELVLQGAIPGEVVGNRDRAPSGLTHEDDALSHNEASNNSFDLADDQELEDELEEELEEEDDEEEEEEEEEKATSLQDKWNLLILASEHDRADILNKLLSEAADESEKFELLHSGLPPLHVSILYGSMNAMNCLLRAGADPSLRPRLAEVPPELCQAVAQSKLLDGVTAWELAFGSQSQIVKTVDLPLSKQEGIRHAFSAEALRCIGADEVHRLQQILDAGVPAELEIGDKSLSVWARDMGATQCEALLVGPVEGQDERGEGNAQDGSEPTTIASAMKEAEMPSNGKDKDNNIPTNSHHSAVLDRPSHSNAGSEPQQESIPDMINRLDELEALARALSSCLDNLAEEVSVCHGLLLMGGGASALAAHVRSLKANKQAKQDELQRWSEAWENTQDELAYWVREAGPSGPDIAAQITVDNNHMTMKSRHSFSETTDETQRRTQLQAQIAASETKVRKLRVSITDLSEENARDLAEVERRGLTGGIQLVRNLKDEIRELEFHLTETKSGEAMCRAKITLLQSKVKEQRHAQDQQQQPVQEQQVPQQQAVQEHPPRQRVREQQAPPQQQAQEREDLVSPNVEREPLMSDAKNTEGAASSEQMGSSGIAAASAVATIPETDSAAAPTVAAETEAYNPEHKQASDKPPNHAASRNIEISQPMNGVSDPNKTAAAPSEPAEPKNSERIATGHSTAIAVSQKGGHGYFTVSLWQIIMRIIGIGENGVPAPVARERNRNTPSQPAVII